MCAGVVYGSRATARDTNDHAAAIDHTENFNTTAETHGCADSCTDAPSSVNAFSSAIRHYSCGHATGIAADYINAIWPDAIASASFIAAIAVIARSFCDAICNSVCADCANTEYRLAFILCSSR